MKTSRFHTASWLSLGLVTLLTTTIHAGTKLQVVHRDLAAGGEPATTTIKIGEGTLRVHQLNRPEEDLLFQAPAETVWLIDHQKKQFYKLTKNDLDGLADQVAGAMKQVQEQLANLPPEQRAMVEKMMQAQMPAGVSLPGAATPPRTGRWEKVASGETVGRWTCDHYRYLEGDTVQREVWTAPLNTAGIDPSAWTVMTQLGDLFKGFAEKMPMVIPKDQIDPASWDLPPDLRTRAFPVKFVEFNNGQPASETVFASIESTSFPADTFAPPEGYQEKSFLGDR
ncbi:MAG: hypothetical protein SNJ84_04810 [Verrucomicrobiia bacterium]